MAEILELENFDERGMKSLCPFHKEDTPSFIYCSKTYQFRCFGACSRNYDIIDALMIKKKMTYAEAVKRLLDKAGIQHSFGEMGTRTKSAYYYPNPVYADNCETVYSYLEKRRISKETADYLGLKQDCHGNMLIQYFDTNDVLTMVKVRPSHKVPHGGVKTWCLKDEKGNTFGTTPILYNMNRINCEAPLAIMCGEMDAAAAIESGFTNAVSIPLGDGNLHWIDECFEWLEQFKEIIICPDNDESGNKFIKTVIPRLGSWRCKIAKVPEQFVKEDGKVIHVKDLNEVLVRWGKEKVREVLTNAQDSPIPSLVDFSDVDDVDLTDIDGIYTGLQPLDKELMRLFFGSLTILSGKPGAGKTSFMYQIACSCLDQGYEPWIFSRELPTYMSRNWINYLFAGRRHVKQYHGENDSLYYKVYPDAKKAIGNYYRGRMFFYRDDYPNDVDSIKGSMIDAARKYGSKLFILDNLTTINLGGTEDAKYTKQTEFINWLIQFSLQYNVATILICHPRKMMATDENVDLYDISGSSNLVNLAHRAISLKRLTDKEKEGVPRRNGKGWEKPPVKGDVVVHIIKDRMLGKSGSDFYLNYDVASRRFFTSPDEFGHQYKWDTATYETPLNYPIKDDTKEIYGESC